MTGIVLIVVGGIAAVVLAAVPFFKKALDKHIGRDKRIAFLL
jgi:hypothetical protein